MDAQFVWPPCAGQSKELNRRDMVFGCLVSLWKTGPDMARTCRWRSVAGSPSGLILNSLLTSTRSLQREPLLGKYRFYQRNTVVSREYPLFQKGNVFLERIWYFKRIRFVLKEYRFRQDNAFSFQKNPVFQKNTVFQINTVFPQN